MEVKSADIARFDTGTVHEVCSTFALAQAMEWAGRLFVLEMKEEDEEGIGTFLELRHLGPAFVGESILVEAKYQELVKDELTCSLTAQVGDRLVATGKTGQKILPKERIRRRFESLKHDGEK